MKKKCGKKCKVLNNSFQPSYYSHVLNPNKNHNRNNSELNTILIRFTLKKKREHVQRNREYIWMLISHNYHLPSLSIMLLIREREREQKT